MPPKYTVVQTKIDSNEEFVCEIYSAWCGPSDAAISTVYQAFGKTLGRKIKFMQVNTKDITELEKFVKDAKPRFLFYKDGELCEAVEGINAPAILRCCEDYLPEGMLEQEEVVAEDGDGDEED